jgi:hypothetical protein
MAQQASGINFSAFGVSRRPGVAIAAISDKGDVRVQLKPLAAFSGKHKLSDSQET